MRHRELRHEILKKNSQVYHQIYQKSRTSMRRRSKRTKMTSGEKEEEEDKKKQ